MSFKKLWAKDYGTTKSNDSLLWKHNISVGERTKELFNRFEPDIISSFKVGCSIEQLKKCATLAGALHDLGKCNHVFQEGIRGLHQNKHPLRHELVSALALFDPMSPLREWLEQSFTEKEILLSVAIIAAHHHRITTEVSDVYQTWVSYRTEDEDDIIAYWDRDLEPLWDWLANEFSLKGRPQINSPWVISLETLPWAKLPLQELSDSLCDEEKLEITIAKSILVVADISISSNPTGPIELGESVKEKDLEPLLQYDPYPFQKETQNSPDRVTLLMAGCGDGKTTAAHYWWSKHAVGKRAIYCYPTTITTTEGCRSYLQEQVKDYSLQHHRARADALFYSVPTPSAAEENPDFEAWKADLTDTWRAKFLVCTVDTVLGFFAHSRKPMALVNLWLEGVFVFDEIHCYDSRLFGYLLEFIRWTKVPVLLMTATLSSDRIKALEEAAGHSIRPIQGRKKRSSAKRYRFVKCQPEEEWGLLQKVQCQLEEGKSVLWRNNSVQRAKDTYLFLRSRIEKFKVICLHSQFRYQRRKEIEENLVELFSSEPCVLVATQVVEISLHLSAGLVITDLAPFSSLVQVAGRGNRIQEVPENVIDIIVLKPEMDLPYTSASLQEAKKLLELIEGQEVSQSDLAEVIKNHLQQEEKYEDASIFTEPIHNCLSHTIRDISYVKNPVIIPEPGQNLKKLSKAQLQLLTCPLPPPKGPPWTQREKGILVAPMGAATHNHFTGGELLI